MRRAARRNAASRSSSTTTANDFLIDKGFNEDFGARPLRRAIERFIEDPLAEEILKGDLEGSYLVQASMVEGAVHFDKELKTGGDPSEKLKTQHS